MIISRTPFRISFLGGGTDLPSFYNNGEEGAVLSTTIDKYIHLTVNDRFDETYRLSYSKTEICKEIDEIEHPIFRAVLSAHAPDRHGLELISMADIPSGTGLGSSSSFTVGLLHALKAHLGEAQKADDLAREACRIEIEELKEPIGKQDQYAAAFGGLQYIRFLPSGEVITQPLICPPKVASEFEQSMLLFFTGFVRDASNILSEQKKNSTAKIEVLREMRQGARRLKTLLESGEPLKKAGELLHEGWQLKRTMASGISSGQIDQWYERGRKAGAWGGKILGAGGGGFLMFLCPPEKHAQVKAELKELRHFPVRFEKLGSRILFVG
jgi:D-glycero-alpha-D-manno-heptose-7-phosphate kinase